MCRHQAYLGPRKSLRELVTDPPHSLFRQSWEPARQTHGVVNADGFGVGWFAEGDPVPARYRQAGPIWADPSFPDIARVTHSGAVLAAVRDATTGSATGAEAAAPYRGEVWLFSHNGSVGGYPGRWRSSPRRCRRCAAEAGIADGLGVRLGPGPAPGARGRRDGRGGRLGGRRRRRGRRRPG